MQRCGPPGIEFETTGLRYYSLNEMSLKPCSDETSFLNYARVAILIT